MPIDDPRWEPMFLRAVTHAYESGCEIYSWMGGNHWPIRNYAINHVPGWHQNKTLEPLVSGVLKASAGIEQALLFDDGLGYALAGAPLTITVYARGNLGRPVSVLVTSKGRGTLSKSRLTLPAGPNGQDSFSYTPADNEVATLTYASAGQWTGPLPPPRKVFSLADTVAYATTSLADAAMAIIAKYGACKWELADGHTDYLLGAPAAAGQVVRAISDSGYGSSPGNAMEMINWTNKDSSAMGAMSLPVMRLTNGRKNSDHTAPDTFGFWCKKSAPAAGVQPRPKNRVPYNLEDAHFALACVSIPGENQHRRGVPGLEGGGALRVRAGLYQRPAPGQLGGCERPDSATDRRGQVAGQYTFGAGVHLGAWRAKAARERTRGREQQCDVRSRRLLPDADRLGLPRLLPARWFQGPCVRGDHRKGCTHGRGDGSA
ncbi:hypothetical protein LP415_20825 [Polaromonas sp. P1(28)-8]|nr:hypothetical protein LP415_20825 [Polaromonas sp. P1(28)-8]